MESKPLVAFQRHIPHPSDGGLNAKVLVKAKGKEYKAKILANDWYKLFQVLFISF